MRRLSKVGRKRSQPRGACSRATSTSASQGSRCRNGSPGPTRGDPKSAPRSSMCSQDKSTEWGWSCSPSVSPAPPSRSAWPTWSITSSAWHGLRGELRLHDIKTAPKMSRKGQNQTKIKQTAKPFMPSAAIQTPSPQNYCVLRGVQLVPALIARTLLAV